MFESSSTRGMLVGAHKKAHDCAENREWTRQARGINATCSQ